MTHQDAFEVAMQHHREGRLPEAEHLYRQLLAVYPGDPEITHLLGVLARDAGHPQAGRELIESAIARNPGRAPYHNNLGVVLQNLREEELAVRHLEEAIRLDPGYASAYYNLGNSMLTAGRPEKAEELFRTALRLQPDYPTAELNLGNALGMQQRDAEAIAYFQAILQRDPHRAEIANNLGEILSKESRLIEALEAYRLAAKLDPNDKAILNNLAATLKEMGHSDEASHWFRASLARDPGDAIIRSNLIFNLHFDPAVKVAEIAAEMRRWEETCAAPHLASWLPHANTRDPRRPLRIGFVSPDLREHVVGRTLLPCFEAHDRALFSFYCYSEAQSSDLVSARFRDGSAGWRETSRMTDDAMAAQIRADGIDILVDLALHTAYDRLLVFARKPAPVQVCWLGYPGATGLRAMDYRLTDRFLDPPGQDHSGGCEKPFRLPHAWTCCPVPAEGPAPDEEPPAVRRGFITFGSCNSFSKTNDAVIAAWAEILRRVPGARLRLLGKGGLEESVPARFGALGIDPARVEMFRYYPDSERRRGEVGPYAYLHRYHEIDIALDPFPYNGMTTTGDALWMSVPVVSLIGQTTVGRATYSLLENVGAGELAVPSVEQYIQLAVALAGDLPRLTTYRRTLRAQMLRSPLLDYRRWARDVEAAYRDMWARWCAAPR